MVCRRFILPLFIGLSTMMAGAITAGKADADEIQERCAMMRLDQDVPAAIGYSLKRMKQDTIDIGESLVVVEPRLAGLRGPNITLLGRDVRLAVTQWQTSPQELWHKGQWNQSRVTAPCQRPPLGWDTSLKRGLHSRWTLDNAMGFTTYEPAILFRTRILVETLQVRPYGFVLGATLSFPLATNTESLLMIPDARPPVRRDIARFAYGVAAERLYASWHTTPLADLHLGITGGYLEEMYAGIGAELMYRPWASAFWIGADGWQTWRRDPSSFMNLHLTNEQRFTGHLRAGYDIPGTRAGIHAAAGKFLAGDLGASVGVTQKFTGGGKITASMSWTNREEDEGFFRDTHFDPQLRVTWPLGQFSDRHKREVRTTFQQVGRDGGQMLDRPMPLEVMTENFSAREVIRHWPEMLAKKEAAYAGGL